uniref:Pentacotripeptide-repeat region of PRORP domain-containing protein n=1 Tax=Solanum lycopersicum TaxID=4081 RepID=K4BIJ4_SOLLC
MAMLNQWLKRPQAELSLPPNWCFVPSKGHMSVLFNFILNVLKRHRSDWKPTFIFFKWILAGENPCRYSPNTESFNEILDILGRMRHFDELNQVLDEMSKRGNLVSEKTYGFVINRSAAAHRVEDAKEFFYKRKNFGLDIDLNAFQILLMCVYAKRFWNDIMTSKCKPDKFKYGIFINSLCKSGKRSRAVELFQTMWEKGCKPDVAICNCIIDGLCFKKRIPEALEKNLKFEKGEEIKKNK